MNIQSLNAAANQTVDRSLTTLSQPSADRPELREKFDEFVGETFFGQLMHSLRSTVGKPAYFHGGRAEEIFQGQLDQQLCTSMTKASADQISGPMFELFQLQRS